MAQLVSKRPFSACFQRDQPKRSGGSPVCEASVSNDGTLLAKEGPPGHGPLHGVPPLAGICLVDAFHWHEALAHHSAFGLHLARSALDSAALIQVLLEHGASGARWWQG